MSDVQVFSKSRRITVDGFKATRTGKLGNGEDYELTDKHMELISECILQTLYNLGIASDANIDFSINVEGGTSYHTIAKDGDVMVKPIDGEPYRRRIRNDRQIFKKKSDFDGDGIEFPNV